MDLLRHLELFRAVAEEGHFGRAAARIGMAQPPLSQAVKRLERELGCVLLDRTSHGAVPTDAGRRVLSSAEELGRAVEDVRAAAGDPAEEPTPLAVDPLLPQAWAVHLVEAVATLGIDLELVPTPTDVALAQARSEEMIAVVLSPFRVEGLRTGEAVPAQLWESRHPSPRSRDTALVHEEAPRAALGRLQRELQGLTAGGSLIALPRATASGRLAAGRVRSVISTERPTADDPPAAGIEVRALPRERAAAVFHVVLRRDARDRTLLRVFDLLTATLGELDASRP